MESDAEQQTVSFLHIPVRRFHRRHVLGSVVMYSGRFFFFLLVLRPMLEFAHTEGTLRPSLAHTHVDSSLT